MNHESRITDSARISALGEASVRAEGTGREVIFDHLLDELCTNHPSAAQIAATVLKAHSSEGSATLADAILARTGPLASVPARAPKPLAVDVLILTVKDKELFACLRAFGIRHSVPAIQLSGSVEVWPATDGELKFAIANIGTDGNVESALAFGSLYSQVDFRAAILIGMAAGVRDRVDLGDIVVAEAVCAYEFQRVTRSGPRFAPKQYSIDPNLIGKVRLMPQFDTKWSERIAREIIEDKVLKDDNFDGKVEGESLTMAWQPKLRTGYILAGSKLLENGALPRMRKELHDRIVAAEMEGEGFAAACRQADIPWVVVRGIADYGEPDRKKSWQLPATYAAARFVKDALRHRRLPLGLEPEHR